MAYNEALAERILAELDELFPHFVSDLNSKTPEFSAVPRDEWKRAVDALVKLCHVKTSFHMEGAVTVSRGVDELEITAEGRQALAQSRRGSMTAHSYYWALSQEFGGCGSDKDYRRDGSRDHTSFLSLRGVSTFGTVALSYGCLGAVLW